MSVQFFGRASGEEVEGVQEPFQAWLRKVLEESELRADFTVVLRAFLYYAEVMARVRVFASSILPRDIIIEIFPPESAHGLCYSLDVPEHLNRSELVMTLRSNAASFG